MAITRQKEETFIYGGSNISVKYKQITTNMAITKTIESVSEIYVEHDSSYMKMYERDFLVFAELVEYVANMIKAKGGEK